MNNGSKTSDNFEASLTAEGRYRLLVEAIRDYAIYMLDRDGTVSNWNAGAERFKGYKASEIVGQHFSKFYTEEDRAAGLPNRVLEIAEREGKFEAEGWRVRKDGSRFWAHVVVDPVRDSFGRVVGFAKITRDLTERRETQLQLERAREALFQAQKMEAIGQLTGGVAHDFNNLLAAVIGSLELLEKRLTDEKLLALVATAKQGASRGANLARRMLAFARRQELKPEPVYIPSLLDSISDLLQRAIGPQTPIECRFPIGLPPVMVDPNHLETAILNLVLNSRDAMPSGGKIEISAHAVVIKASENGLEAGRYVLLQVADNGEGMDEETVRRAAEPFFTTKGVGKGTGLGLSMTQGLAEQSGGKLTITSQKGVGTTVEIWLPAADAVPRTSTPPTQRTEQDAASAPNLTILAVDDDSLVLMNTVAMLEDLGHKVEKASSARQALEILERIDAIDLVLTDQAMPGMSGIDLICELRRQQPEMPVIIATGYSELPQKIEGVTRLAKPFFQEDLRNAIARARA